MRKVKATVALLAISFALATSSVGRLRYGEYILGSAPRWARITFGVGAVVACTVGSGGNPLAGAACGVAAVLHDQPLHPASL
jgi:hypothetical protein